MWSFTRRCSTWKELGQPEVCKISHLKHEAAVSSKTPLCMVLPVIKVPVLHKFWYRSSSLHTGHAPTSTPTPTYTRVQEYIKSCEAIRLSFVVLPRLLKAPWVSVLEHSCRRQSDSPAKLSPSCHLVPTCLSQPSNELSRRINPARDVSSAKSSAKNGANDNVFAQLFKSYSLEKEKWFTCTSLTKE